MDKNIKEINVQNVTRIFAKYINVKCWCNNRGYNKYVVSQFAKNPDYKMEKGQKAPISPITLDAWGHPERIGPGENHFSKWGVFDDVEKSYTKEHTKSGKYMRAGIGVMLFDADQAKALNSKNRLCVFDIDHINELDEVQKEHANKFLRESDTYVEYSPSGNGLHAWLEIDADMDAPATKTQPREYYCCGHFMSVTGNVYADYDKPIRHVDLMELRRLYGLFFWDAEKEEPKKREYSNKPITSNEKLELLTPAEMMSYFRDVKIMNSSKGEMSFTALDPTRHDHKNGSLIITFFGSYWLAYDFSSCARTKEIMSAVGLKGPQYGWGTRYVPQNFEIEESENSTAPSWKEEIESKIGDGAQVTSCYPWLDGKGNYMFSKVCIEYPDENGEIQKLNWCIKISSDSKKYIKCAANTSGLLYGARDITNHKHGPVYVAGNERCAEVLKEQDLWPVVSVWSNASDWDKKNKALLNWFKGKDVVVCCDNETLDSEDGNIIAGILKNVCFRVKVYFPGCENKKIDDCIVYEEDTESTDADLKTIIKGIPWEPGHYVNADDKGKIKVNADLLAETVENYEYFCMVPTDDNKTDLYIYRNGTYVQATKPDFTKHCIQHYIPRGYGSAQTINNVYNLLLYRGERNTTIDRFDKDEKLINVKNGLLDIETGELKPHTPNYLSRFQLNVNYNPVEEPNAPNFEKLLNGLCSDETGSMIDDDKKKLILEVMGLTFSNVIFPRTKKSLFLYSAVGNTGKSQLLLLMDYILNGATINIDLSQLDYNKNRFVLGDIERKVRCIMSPDQSGNDIKDSMLFKRLVTYDGVSIERKNHDPRDFHFPGSFIVACNKVPYFCDDYGKHMTERIIILECKYMIPVKDRDKNLKEKLQSEADSIFYMCFMALKDLVANNLNFTECADVERAIEEYRENCDPVYKFVKESIELTSDASDVIGVEEMYNLYLSWVRCSESDAKVPLSSKTFKERLRGYGIGDKKINRGKAYFCVKRKEDDWRPAENVPKELEQTNKDEYSINAD